MKVLITGAAGFLGGECVRQFRESGYEVITTDITGVVDYLGDLSDECFVSSLPNVDIVLNCAAVQYVSSTLPFFFRTQYFHINNVIAANNICQRYCKSSVHLIHIGTSMMYEQTGKIPYTENSKMVGEGDYSYSKMKAQKYVNAFPSSATIIPCIIGGRGREGLFVNFINMMKRYSFVCFPGNGVHKIHMVHVSDVASLALTIAQVRACGIYNAAAPNPLSIREWISEIEKELQLRIPTKIITLPLFPITLLSQILCYRILAHEQLLMLKIPHVLDIEKSLNLGWRPKFSNINIVRDIARYIDSKTEID